jgi:hypothetical protein
MHWGYKALAGCTVLSMLFAMWALVSGLDGCPDDEAMHRRERAEELIVGQLPNRVVEVVREDECSSGAPPQVRIRLSGDSDPVSELIAHHGWTRSPQREVDSEDAYSGAETVFEDHKLGVTVYEVAPGERPTPETRYSLSYFVPTARVSVSSSP